MIEGILDSSSSGNVNIKYNLINENNKIENNIKHINKFDLDYTDINDYYNDPDSREDSKDSTNEINTSEEYLETNNKNSNKTKNKFNKPKKQKQKKKKQGKFKSTAADFKVKYKTELCKYYEINGYCPYGNRCQFAHQLTTNIINNPYDRKMTYKKTLETISKFENVENIKELIAKPRLSIFKEFVQNKKSIKSRLLDDIKKIHKDVIIERIDDE